MLSVESQSLESLEISIKIRPGIFDRCQNQNSLHRLLPIWAEGLCPQVSIAAKNYSGKVLMTMSTDLVRALFDEVDAAGDYGQAGCCGRGIVICAGGPVMLANAYVLVRVLRDIHETALPIEIWHMGPAEMPDLLANIFAKTGCTIVDALSVGDPEDFKLCDGWQLKAFALKNSSFEEVILLDADQVPLRDPALLFEWPEYKATGAVFWPDTVDIAADNPIWQMLGLPGEQVRSWESGQVCIDKQMHWRTLSLVLAINQRAETFYRFVYGDKDTFLLAWQLTGSDVSLVPHLPFQAERYMVQRDFSGNPLFQHHTNCKWSLTRSNEEHEGLELFAECQGFIEELARVWNGYVFHAPSRSIPAQIIEQDLIARRHFSMTRDGPLPVEVELLQGHQIGKGRSHDLMNWYVDQHDDEFVLVLRDRHRIMVQLARQLPDRWLGRGGSRSEETFSLEPLPAAASARASPEQPIDLVTGLVRVAGKRLPELDCALELLAQADPGIVRQIEIAAAMHEADDAALASHLAKLAARLGGAGEKPAASVRHLVLDDPHRYVRP